MREERALPLCEDWRPLGCVEECWWDTSTTSPLDERVGSPFDDRAMEECSVPGPAMCA